MNEMFRRPSLPLTTQAAEGLVRRRWTVAEIEAMVAAGILGEHERFELIGGEVVPMSPRGPGTRRRRWRWRSSGIDVCPMRSS